MALSTTRPEGIYKYNTTLGDIDGQCASLIDTINYDKGQIDFRGIEAGPGLKVWVRDADDGRFNTTETKIVLEVDGSLGEANTFSSLGAAIDGEEIIGTKVELDLQFKRVKGGSGIVVHDFGSHLEIQSVASGAGEANDGMNIGTSGIGVYDGKTGATLNFRNISAGADGKLVVSLDGNHNIVLTVDSTKFDLSEFGGNINVAKITGLAPVATSGSYVDLTNKPTLFSGSYTDLSNKPALFSGAWDDLTNKPTILNQTNIFDIVGGMVSGNTENGVAVTYDNIGHKLNFTVSSASIASDTTPHLGGDLDVGAYKIVSSSGDITLNPTPTGKVIINGVEYSGRMLVNIIDNQQSEVVFHTFAAAPYEAVIMDYVILRGTNCRMGQLMIINNGSTASYSDAGPDIGNVGVNFNTVMNGGSVEVKYTSTNLGVGGTISYMIRRWNAN